MRALFVSALFVSGLVAGLCGPARAQKFDDCANVAEWVRDACYDGQRSRSDFEAAQERADKAAQDEFRQRVKERAEAQAAQEAALAKQATARREALVKAREQTEAKRRESERAGAFARTEEILKVEAAARAEAADEFKLADILDLEAAPDRFLGKKVKLAGMSCYAPAPGDYRCVSGPSSAVVFSRSAEPAEARAQVEEGCETVRTAVTDACQWVVRFKVDDFHVDKMLSGEGRIVITPATVRISRELYPDLASDPAR